MVSSQVATFTKSEFASDKWQWKTATDYLGVADFPVQQFLSVADFLLTNPNHLSSHLFRADILYDSSSLLETPIQKERQCFLRGSSSDDVQSYIPNAEHLPLPANPLPRFSQERSVVRRLIPRKPQVDKPLDQTCHFYSAQHEPGCRVLMYLPHVATVNELPFYHPPVQGFAYLFRSANGCDGAGSLSVHVLPFKGQDLDRLPERICRMFASTLTTFIRLARQRPEQRNTVWRPPRDNVVPQHVVQNTYTRLKEAYAADLIKGWVEKTEPSKHVFEDLSIAAFLIELWRQMYGTRPSCEGRSTSATFPGFVDIACGNGVLVYILMQEGYQGWGFDARRRRTWSTFPFQVQDCLKETICIPKPFQEAQPGCDSHIDVHDGLFPKDTFIISNHADELTPWTPLIAVLSDPATPLPFLAIPCCSHALDGLRYRYKAKRHGNATSANEAIESDDQPASGDLRKMREAKKQQSPADPSASTYSSLTMYVSELAEEVGYDIQQTLLRIPSTRNIGILGRRLPNAGVDKLSERVYDIVSRECELRGGIDGAALTWVTRAKELNAGKSNAIQHGQ